MDSSRRFRPVTGQTQYVTGQPRVGWGSSRVWPKTLGLGRVDGGFSRVRTRSHEANPRLSGYWVCPVTG